MLLSPCQRDSQCTMYPGGRPLSAGSSARDAKDCPTVPQSKTGQACCKVPRQALRSSVRACGSGCLLRCHRPHTAAPAAVDTRWIHQNCMLCEACLWKNVLYTQGKLYIAKNASILIMAPFCDIWGRVTKNGPGGPVSGSAPALLRIKEPISGRKACCLCLWRVSWSVKCVTMTWFSLCLSAATMFRHHVVSRAPLQPPLRCRQRHTKRLGDLLAARPRARSNQN